MTTSRISEMRVSPGGRILAELCATLSARIHFAEQSAEEN